MAPWQLPTSLIYLQAILRPRLLRPDLLVPSVSHVDWPALRRRGFNAVVIDKDNCLTWPERDELHPSIQRGWSSLKTAFGADRVLVVSNSAGTRKDEAGVAAESVSRHLGAPVLLHTRKKPGCAAQILDYLEGRTGINERAAVEAAAADLSALVPIEDVKRPLLGGERVRPAKEEVPPGPLARRQLERPNADTPDVRSSSADAQPLRILVVGDRLATDMLLARRLAASLPGSPAGPAAVVSIVTTGLFKKMDVTPLRWLETRWLGLARRARTPDDAPREDWGRFVLDRALDAMPLVPVGEPAGIAARGGFLGIFDRMRTRIRGFFTLATLRRGAVGALALSRTAIRRVSQAAWAQVLRGWQRVRSQRSRSTGVTTT